MTANATPTTDPTTTPSTAATPPSPSLHALFDPSSVALIGASATAGKWGHAYAKQLLAGQDRRAVYLINARRQPALGQTTYGSVDELPDVPEVAVICVPAAEVLDVVDGCLQKGVRLLVCITAGFAEMGEDGAAVQSRLADKIKGVGARMVGPNCVGIHDSQAELHCTGFWDLPPGNIGMVSQSGGLMIELGVRFSDQRLGFSRAVSLGNQADLKAADFIELYADDPNTQSIICYIESFSGARRLFQAMEKAVAAGKRPIVLTPGSSVAAARSVRSHTAAMMSNDAIVDSVCADVGAILVNSVDDLLRALEAERAPTRMSGRRVAVLADGGGSAALGTSAITEAGFDMPELSAELQKRLSETLPTNSALSNPVDIVGALDIDIFLPAVEEIAASGEVDGLLIAGALNNAVADVDEDVERAVSNAITADAVKNKVGLAVSSWMPSEPAIEGFRSLNVPVTDFPAEAAKILRYGLIKPPRRAVPTEPRSAEGGRTEPLPYLESKRVLQRYGIAFPETTEVADKHHAIAAAESMGFPVVLKATGTFHKSDSGGVAVGLLDCLMVSDAFDRVRQANSTGPYCIEQQIPADNGVEILVGGNRDPNFGSVVMVGLGGTLTELLGDTVVAIGPVTADYAKEMLTHLRGYSLLTGYRGALPVDLDGLCRTIAAFSDFFSQSPDVAEAELNPVIVSPSGAFAVDARILTTA